MRVLSLQAERRRPAFTLIEILVVVSLILVLATLTVAFAPRFTERERVVTAADQLQGGMLIAKQRARNDRSPTGLRLVRDPNNPKLVRELQYVQQPDDFSGGVLLSAATNTLIFREVDFGGGIGGANESLWPVQSGDYIEIKGGGLMHLITKVASANSLLLASPAGPLGSPTSQYRIVRGPRLLQGEKPLQLPESVILDLAKSVGLPPDPSSGGLAPSKDILFAPSGAVLHPAGLSDKIILWVRDGSLEATNPGEQFLVTIYKRTGLIAVHPVDTGSTDPYSYTRDGRSSGL